MRSLNYSGGYVGLTNTNHPVYGDVRHSWSKADFEAEFSVTLDNFDKVVYEPDRGMYIVVDKDSTEIRSFSDPSGHPALARIHQYFNAVLARAIEQHIRETTDPYYALSLSQAKEVKRQRIKNDLLAFFDTTYSLDQQTLMNSLGILPSTPNDIKLDIAECLEWVKQVMYSFFITLNDIQNAGDLAALMLVVWDFSQLLATKPAHTIQSLYTRLYLSEH